MMVNGRGGPAHPAAALQLFEQAAAKGHSGAMFALGAMHGGGHDLPVAPPRNAGSAPLPNWATAMPS